MRPRLRRHLPLVLLASAVLRPPAAHADVVVGQPCSLAGVTQKSTSAAPTHVVGVMTAVMTVVSSTTIAKTTIECRLLDTVGNELAGAKVTLPGIAGLLANPVTFEAFGGVWRLCTTVSWTYLTGGSGVRTFNCVLVTSTGPIAFSDAVPMSAGERFLAEGAVTIVDVGEGLSWDRSGVFVTWDCRMTGVAPPTVVCSPVDGRTYFCALLVVVAATLGQGRVRGQSSCFGKTTAGLGAGDAGTDNVERNGVDLGISFPDPNDDLTTFVCQAWGFNFAARPDPPYAVACAEPHLPVG